MLSSKAKVPFLTTPARLAISSRLSKQSGRAPYITKPLNSSSLGGELSCYQDCIEYFTTSRRVCRPSTGRFWCDLSGGGTKAYSFKARSLTSCLQRIPAIVVGNCNHTRELAAPLYKIASLHREVVPSNRISSCTTLNTGRSAFRASKGTSVVCAPAVEDTMAEAAVLELDEQEKQLFKTLLGTLKYHRLQTQLRVAGGWVRDKLLGKECKDIDIALDNMLGKDFADKVNEYFVSINEETRTRHVIQSNPDQSKHLETATMMVHGTSIDFVNLRAEEYASASRIPTMVFGTPEQDAYRRDLTINSLFYNINTEAVEDFTKRGLADLREGIIRTPLPPVQTFLDDPLRVLRAVRFGSRFGFRLDPDLVEAASSKEVRGALEAKVSRERVGIEVDKMLGGPHPEKAMEHLSDLRLFPSVFTVPPSVARAVPGDAYGPRCLGALHAVANVATLVRAENASSEERKLLLLAGLFLPLRNVAEKDRKGKMVPITQSIIMEALKLKAEYARVIALLHSGAEEFREVATMLQVSHGEHHVSLGSHGEHMPPGDDDLSSPTAKKRIATGLLLKKLKHLWRSALLISSVLDQPAATAFGDEIPASHSPPNDDAEPNGKAGPNGAAVRAAKFYHSVESSVLELGLERVWEMKPLLDGKAIMVALDIQGREMAVWVDRAARWQLANPEGSADECRLWLKQMHAKSKAS